MSWDVTGQGLSGHSMCHDPRLVPGGQDMQSFPWHALTIRQMARIICMTIWQAGHIEWPVGPWPVTSQDTSQFLLLLENEGSAWFFFVLNVHRCWWVWGRYPRVSWQRNMYEHHRKLHLYVCGRLHWRWTPMSRSVTRQNIKIRAETNPDFNESES